MIRGDGGNPNLRRRCLNRSCRGGIRLLPRRPRPRVLGESGATGNTPQNQEQQNEVSEFHRTAIIGALGNKKVTNSIISSSGETNSVTRGRVLIREASA